MTGMGFFSGFATAAFAASAVFFLKLWRVSRDRFYLLFCIASALLSIERVLLFWVKDPSQGYPTSLTEGTSWVYLMRLSSFLVIFAAIIHKNRTTQK